MPVLSSLISALIMTYALSRLTWRALPWLPPGFRLVAAHVASLLVLMAAVGLIKSYFVTFAFGQTLVLIGPAILWLAVDWMRGKAAHPGGVKERARAAAAPDRRWRPTAVRA